MEGEEQEPGSRSSEWWLLVGFFVLLIGGATLELRLVTIVTDRPTPTWNPLREPLAAGVFLVPAVAVCGLGRITKHGQADATAQSRAMRLRLPPELVTRILDSLAFDELHRGRPADDVPAAVFEAHLRAHASEGPWGGPARFVARATAVVWCGIFIGFLFAVVLFGADPFLSYLVVGVSAGMVWFARQNLDKAQLLDGAGVLWRDLGVSRPRHSDESLARTWHQRAIWAHAVFPLWALVMLGLEAVVLILRGFDHPPGEGTGLVVVTAFLLPPLASAFCEQRRKTLEILD